MNKERYENLKTKEVKEIEGLLPNMNWFVASLMHKVAWETLFYIEKKPICLRSVNAKGCYSDEKIQLKLDYNSPSHEASE